MASPTETVSSASSPANIAPAPPLLAIKTKTATPSMASIAPNGVVPLSALGPKKEWVIPPRPKPGRKPATDTPPTKRKAQNRAAQRAFRERRAARVGELEEQLKETEEERHRHEASMQKELSSAQDEISRLEVEVRRFAQEAMEWRGRYTTLEERFNVEKKENESLVAELAYLRNGARSKGTTAVPLPPRRRRTQNKAQTVAASQIPSPADEIEPMGCGNCTKTGSCECVEQATTISASGCGRCGPDSHCECLEETLKVSSLDDAKDLDTKRPLSPTQDSVDAKRPRLSIETEPQEIDFTAKFSTKLAQPEQPSPQEMTITSLENRPPAEPCGFCAEGTYCACADAAAAMVRENENRLPPLLNEVTPPPSDTDVTTADNFKLPSLHPNHRVHHALASEKDHSSTLRSNATPANSCVNGPGTCQQCQEDPRSGLFCRSLAAIRASAGSSNDASAGGCCGGSTPGGGCCKSQPALSCADTYKTLASHKNFDEASDELGNWLPKLHAVTPRYPGRAALDIEAASVMNVIKYFDVRFGRD